ncbi:MAG: hemagglutinin repeat-containing protein, partial [Pseudomonadota bacterium]
MRESLKQLLIGFMIGLMLCPPSLVFAGGIQVDTSAPAANQATMDAAQNGVPVVNIAAPGGNGMSHNMFTDFNVGSQGVILNNSVAPGVSQLGGALAQNPNLGGQAASTILNEVTGTGRSSIEGFTEIFGQSANYILANPNGISINGGGFINTSKTTMATGTPQFSGGVFQGLDVRGGDILIHGAGVNAANIDAFEVVTRAAQINADIHAKRLSIVTGQNRHNLVSGTTTPLAPDGSPAPAISIDSSALGGMYAGRITLVGTEAGVGVNTKGLVQSTEHLEMTVDGKIQVTNTVTSSGTMTLTSQDSIDVSGTVKAVGTATLNAPTVTVAKVDPADSPIISGGALAINAGTLNNEQLIAADTAATIAATTLNNTGTIYSGGTATFRIGDRLYNNRGTILAKNDMLLEGAVAGQKMATLQNDSGTIESLDGGLVVRATTLNNTTLGTVVNAAATSVAGSAKGGIYYVYGDKANRGQTMYQEMGGTGSAPANAYVVSSGEWYLWDLIGLGPKRVVTWDEFDAVHQAFDTSSLSATDLTYFNNLRSNILGKSGQYIIKGTTAWQDSGAYFAQTFEDELVSRGIAGKFLAHTGLAVEADALTTNQGVFQTTQGDLSITADTITYDGFTLYRRELVKWAVGKANNHGGSWLERHDSGQESILDPMSTLRNSFVSGGSVLITANSITGQDEFRDPNTIVNAPDPAAQAQKVADVTTLTDALPANGLFQPNANPAQNYLIETNPALTNLDTFYGSDYALSRMGFDPNAEANKRLGDAFFETRLVREQIFELSGLRFLDAAVTTDTAQMVALMDNAVQARTDLNLSVGIALSADQVAALTSDIIWFEYQEVNGQQVLVPVVYLGSASLLKLAQGDSIIIGDEVRIATTGDTANTASIVAKNGLEITAANFLNMPGSAVRSSDVSIAATESIRNTGGSIAGNTVSLTAGQDVVIASETLAKTSQHGSETVVSRTGSVTATGDLTIEAGENVGILGARVESGGDTTLKAGESVAISTIETQMRHSVAESQFNARTDATANTGSTVTAGGALSIEAGQDTAIHGSRVESGGDTDIMAGGSVAITAAQNTWDGTYYGKRGSGGLFGGGKGSESSEVRGVAAKQSTLASGGSVTVQAGAAGSGDVVLQGSQVTAGQDATLKAEGDIQATATRTENYSKFQEEKSGFMGTKSMASDESSSVAHTRPEIEAGGKVTLDAKQDVILQAARITSGDATEITAQDGHVAMLVVKDSEYKREVKSDTGFFSWSSKDQGSLDETVQHTEIFAEKGLTLTTAEGVTVEYKETGNLQQDIAQLAQAPGLEWMAEVAARDDVNWQAVQEVHDQWSKSDSGIGGPGMQLVSLAMAVALSMTGVGTGVAGTLVGSAQGGSAFGAWAAANGLHGALTTSLAAGFNA